MNLRRTSRRHSLPRPFETFILQKTKPAPPPGPEASDLEEVCESRGQGEKAWKQGLEPWKQGLEPASLPWAAALSAPFQLVARNLDSVCH